jgi:hypothetical protein
MKPYKCPVCEGRGFVNECFYDDCEFHEPIGGITEPCQSCNATGVVWGSPESEGQDDIGD